MKKAGIVCEYNPMHNGHVYQIEKTRQAGATHIVCVMSGNFVQRGEAAFCDKWTRADIAVHCGADLVVDLPTPWSCDSAENFAFGAVSILDSLGIDMLSFGSETDDTELLKQCAASVNDKKVGELIKSYVAQGKSYPSALHAAVNDLFGEAQTAAMSSPNSTLAIEYIRALRRVGSKAEPFAVKRNDNGHDASITAEQFASSRALRALSDFSFAKSYMPGYAFERISESINNGFFVRDGDCCDRMILSALRSMSLDEMKPLLCDESGLSERIFSAVKFSCTLGQVLENAKNKSVTMARLRRSLIRLFLKIPAEISMEKPPFIRVLAANQRGLELLKNAASEIPVVTKHSDITKLGEAASRVYEIQRRSTDLYMLMSEKIRACSIEETSPVIIVK